MAVLPTPGSPISTGLFLVRRCSTWMVRRISFVAADHRVELAEFGPLGQVDGVLLQRLAVLLGVGIIDLLAATHLVDGRFQFLLGQTLGAQQLPQVALLVEGCQHEQLGRG